MELHKASNQWSTRPADERFSTLEALRNATAAYRDNAIQAPHTDLASLTVLAADGGEIEIIGVSGKRAVPTHNVFGQLCARAKAPAGYLRSLPAHVAAEALGYGLAKASDEDRSASLLLRQNGRLELRAATSEKYARIWNVEVADALLRLQADQPSWVFPEAFRSASGRQGWGDKHTIPVAYASDHDLFVFLCDYDHAVQNNGESLFRGFFVENSEVGAAAFTLTTFLFDMVCANVIVWGAREVHELSVRHVGSARERAFRELSVEVKKYADGSASEQAATIARARVKLLGDKREDVISSLFARKIPGLGKGTIGEAFDAAERSPRYGDPRSVWGIVNGLTEVSQAAPFATERAAIDRAAGRVLQTVF